MIEIDVYIMVSYLVDIVAGEYSFLSIEQRRPKVYENQGLRISRVEESLLSCHSAYLLQKRQLCKFMVIS